MRLVILGGGESGVGTAIFGKKKGFYSERDGQYDAIKASKEALIEKAHALSQSTDWKTATQQIIALQNQWKKTGSAGPKFENKLWKKFRQPIDAFFAATLLAKELF